MLILDAEFKLGMTKYIYICFYRLTRDIKQLKKSENIKTEANQTKPVKIIILTNTQNINKHAQL